MRLELRAGALARALFGISGVLGAAGFAAVFWHHRVLHARGQEPKGWVRLFGLNQEANVPTWFATVLLLIVALLAWVSARESADRSSASDDERVLARGFRLVAFVFAFLSLDEASSIHEFISAGLGEGEGALRFFWVVPYGLGVIVLAVFLWPWYRALDSHTRRLSTVAAIGFVGAAIGLEMAQGLWTTRFGWGLGLDLLTALEELCEMLSVALFAAVLAKRLARRELHLELQARG